MWQDYWLLYGSAYWKWGAVHRKTTALVWHITIPANVHVWQKLTAIILTFLVCRFSLYSKEEVRQLWEKRFNPSQESRHPRTSPWSLPDERSVSNHLLCRATEAGRTSTVIIPPICHEPCTTGFFLAWPNTSHQTYCLLLLVHVLAQSTPAASRAVLNTQASVWKSLNELTLPD